jgi:AcrR family transcriptional regulator
MKTADRILLVARTLFNEQGERNVTAADIALELDMSPGNLYYHFKGKESIIAALYGEMQRDLAGLLSAPLDDPTLFDTTDTNHSDNVERSWLFLTVVFEKMYEYRFVYLNLVDLMQHYPEVDRGMRRLIRLKRAACLAISIDLVADQMRGRHDPRLVNLADAMTLNLTWWLSYNQLLHHGGSETSIIHSGVLQILSFCAPYLERESDFFAECEQLYARMLANDANHQ